MDESESHVGESALEILSTIIDGYLAIRACASSIFQILTWLCNCAKLISSKYLQRSANCPSTLFLKFKAMVLYHFLKILW